MADYYEREREALRQVLSPAPRPWPGAVREAQARLLADLDRLGAAIERQRIGPRARERRAAQESTG